MRKLECVVNRSAMWGQAHSMHSCTYVHAPVRLDLRVNTTQANLTILLKAYPR